MKDLKKLRVLHVVGAMNRAGTETMLMNVYRNIDHDTFQFDFISYSKEKADYDEEIERLNGKVIRLTKTSSIRQIRAAIKKHGPYDVVHAHTLFHCGIAMVAAFLAGVKIRISHAHTTLDTNNSYIRIVYMQIMCLMIKVFSTNLLACSEEAGKYLFGKKGVTKQKYTYFPNPIDYNHFIHVPEKGIDRFKREEGIENGIVVGHIGTFKQSKNHQFILEITEQLIKREPKLNLLLVGDGELRKEIERKANEKELTEHIKFLGKRENIPTILHSMDVFIFPSIYEGLGLVLLEAQASGVPCIVSDAIQPEADLGLNLIVKMSLSEDPDRWAKEIIQLVDQKEKNTQGIIDRFEANGYSLSKGISLLMKLYHYSAGGTYEERADHLI